MLRSHYSRQNGFARVCKAFASKDLGGFGRQIEFAVDENEAVRDTLTVFRMAHTVQVLDHLIFTTFLCFFFFFSEKTQSVGLLNNSTIH